MLCELIHGERSGWIQPGAGTGRLLGAGNVAVVLYTSSVIAVVKAFFTGWVGLELFMASAAAGYNPMRVFVQVRGRWQVVVRLPSTH